MHDDIYRIELGRDVSVMYIGLSSIDTELDGTYDGISALPEWLQHKIAVLSVLQTPPPLNDVRGVGRRISDNVFWVYPD